MKEIWSIGLVALALSSLSIARGDAVISDPFADEEHVNETPRVVAVYSSLPEKRKAPVKLTTKQRPRRSRPSFSLPPQVYMIGAPILLLIFLIVISTFLREGSSEESWNG